MRAAETNNAAIEGGKPMTLRTLTAVLVASGLVVAGTAQAQAPNLDAIPDKMPFANPYGAPISMARAEALIQAAVAESNKRGWAMNIAVVDSGANLDSHRRA
jgi:glc operon protein GlcG